MLSTIYTLLAVKNIIHCCAYSMKTGKRDYQGINGIWSHGASNVHAFPRVCGAICVSALINCINAFII